MTNLFWWIISRHGLALIVGALTFGFAASILGQRRPTGSAAAWLLLIVLVPYLGIPLYLSLGGRKVGRARKKPSLATQGEGLRQAFDELPTLASSDWAVEQQHTGSSKVEWLVDGVSAYRAFLAEISAAKHCIRIQTFIIGDDPTGRSLVDALIVRLGEGVEVEILLDDLLAFHAPRAHLDRFRAAGGQLSRFMPLLHLPFRGRANLRNHRKLAVFDGTRAIVGGMNLADEYMGPEPSASRFRDLSVLVEGPSAGALDAIFRADWEFASGRTLRPLVSEGALDPRIRLVPSGPDCPTDTIYEALLTAIFRADRRVWVATPYFVPDDGLARALEIAARRGVDVRVLVPEHSNHRLADVVAGPSLRELSLARGKVHRYLPGMLHAKAVLVDDGLAIIGSANFDMRSLFLDYEIALLFSTPAEVSALHAWFDATFAMARLGPPEAGWLRAGAERACRLLAPLI